MENSPGNNSTDYTKIIFILLGLCVIGYVLFTYAPQLIGPINISQNKNNTQKSVSSTDGIRQKFPNNLPIEENTQFIKTATTTPDGTKYSLVFDSGKTVTDNYLIYKDYCVNTGWNINEKTLIKSLANNFKGLLCLKSGETLSVVIGPPLPAIVFDQKNTSGGFVGGSSVTLTYTTKKP